MPITELSQDRIRHLYELYKTELPWQGWYRTFLVELEDVSQVEPEQLTTEDWQSRLWALKGVASLGQGEHVDVSGATTDPDVVNNIVGLRRRWPDEPNARAKAIQAAFDRILNRVRDEHANMRPQAKLGRLFMALLPAETHAGFSWPSNRNVLKLVLGPRRGLGYIEAAVLVRLRLRSVLGSEDGLGEHVHRAIFCWWLHEHFDAIARGEDPPSGEQSEEDDPEEHPLVSEEVELLELWPANRQFKGVFAIRGYQEGLRAVVAAAEQGATPDDIVETMRTDHGFTQVSPRTCRSFFNRVRRLGFLTHEDGLWYPSEKGERLLNEDPPDVLVEELLVKFFGPGHLLRALSAQDTSTREDLVAYLQGIWPTWSTDFAPSSLLGWATSLGLAERLGRGQLRLTEYGQAWHQRLPRVLRVPDPVDRDPEPSSVAEVSTVQHETALPWPTLSQVLEAFGTDDQARRFIFTDDQIRGLHLAWHSQPKKRFALLSGLSGTGKTQILLHYARLYCKLLGLDDKAAERQRAVVAVSPDWRDPTGLLGYFNALHADPTFQVEPALGLVLAASRNPHLPFFLVLDEMNLARVERYFAPFLSAMESGEPLVLHAHDEPVNSVPPKVPWPTNLFIGGTVNMDETTHPFSDKVLDRAFTLEFWDVDLEGWFPRRVATHEGRRFEEVESLLIEVNRSLTPIRRHFGYRSADEILGFIDAAAREEPELSTELQWTVLDQALFSKVLPRLRGTESPALHTAFDALRSTCSELPRCVAKLEAMQEQLRATGVTRFWA